MSTNPIQIFVATYENETEAGQALKDFAPSSNLFNHCIVRLRLNGSTYWLDPTLRDQSGTLETVFQPHAGWALPMREELSIAI